jgi:hypothetical protein
VDDATQQIFIVALLLAVGLLFAIQFVTPRRTSNEYPSFQRAVPLGAGIAVAAGLAILEATSDRLGLRDGLLIGVGAMIAVVAMLVVRHATSPLRGAFTAAIFGALVIEEVVTIAEVPARHAVVLAVAMVLAVAGFALSRHEIPAS